jgi:UDPglucose 6-dehydrogenase
VRIAIVGTGYVGLVTGVCMAAKGHDVVCVDIDEHKIRILQDGKSPIYEDGLEDLMLANRERLTYTTDYAKAFKNAEVIFICVGTPEKQDGSANLSYVFSVAEQIARTVAGNCVVVVKSTVPVGTNDRVEKIINKNNKYGVRIDVVSNPEFLSQGTALEDALHANRIVVGVENANAERAMRDLYRNYDSPVLFMGRRSSEMVKYASNDFLALKLSYINEIANLCEIVGADVVDVARGVGYDERIGSKFLNAGIGYGGSCFPKDAKALHWLANMNDYELKTIKAAIEVNGQQKLKLIKKAKKYYSSFEGLTIAVLGLAFKPGTDDLREAPSLENIAILLEEGARIKAYDPVAQLNFRKLYPTEIIYCDSIGQTLEGADLCFILTEWKDIVNMDTGLFEKVMKRPVILDMNRRHVIYDSIGRSCVRWKSV